MMRVLRSAVVWILVTGYCFSVQAQEASQKETEAIDFAHGLLHHPGCDLRRLRAHVLPRHRGRPGARPQEAAVGAVPGERTARFESRIIGPRHRSTAAFRGSQMLPWRPMRQGLE